MSRSTQSGQQYPTLARIPVLLILLLGSLGIPRAVEANDQNDPALRAYLSANGMLNRGLYELAAVEYRRFLSAHADHEKAPTARYGLGVSLFRMKRYEEALSELTPLQGRDEFEFAAEVGTIIGQCHLTQRRHDKAAEAFQRVVRRHEQHELADEAAVGLVEALYLNGQHDETVDSCQYFVAKWPDSPHRERAEFFGGLSTMAKKNYAGAASRFEAQLQRFPKGPFAEQASLLLAQCHHHNNAAREAIRQYRKVLKQAGSRYIPDALHGLGTLLRREGNASEAGEVLDQLLQAYPDSPLSQSARFLRGRAWFDEGEYSKAFELFKQLASEDSEWQDRAAYWAAKGKLREGDFDTAAARFEQAIREFADSELLPEMLYDRSVALVRAERHDEAVGSLEKYGSQFPQHALAAEALELLATTQHQRRNYKESRELCRAFLERFPSHKLALRARFLMGENSFLSANYDDAVTDYRDFLNIHPDHQQAVTARFRMGTALYRLQRHEEAIESLASVTDGAQTATIYQPALLALGDIHFQRSEWKQAEQYLSDYLSFGSDATAADDALLKLGLSRQRQSRDEEAIAAYETLIERFTDSPHRLQAIFERGQALVSVGRLGEAKQALQTVIDTDDRSRFAPYALNHLATMAVQDRQFSEASRLYERVLRSTSEAELAADALFQHGQSLMAARRFQEAEAAFARFISEHSSHARVAEADAQHAISLARQDRYGDAIKAIEQVERKRGSALNPSLQATLGYEKAWCLRELGQAEDAADAYRQLLSGGSPEDLSTHAMLELSGIEFNAKHYDQAAKLLRRLRDIIRENPAQTATELREQATYRLGVCEFELGQFDDAAELFEEFLEAFEDSSLTASACYYCGEAWFKLNHHQKAAKHLARISEEFESTPVLEPSLLRLGESLAVLQRWARSERVFTNYLERFSQRDQWFQAQFGVGWARENQQRYDEAISAYRQVVDRHQGPTAARAQFQIGECLFAKGQYSDAVRELLKVDILYAYPEWSAAALYEAGRCFQKLGKLVEARNHFNQVATQYGQTRWAELATQQLTEVSGASLPGR